MYAGRVHNKLYTSYFASLVLKVAVFVFDSGPPKLFSVSNQANKVHLIEMARSSCKLLWDFELFTKGSHYLFIIRSSSSSLSLSFSFSLSFLLRFLYFCLIESLLRHFRRLLLHRLRLKRKTKPTLAQCKWKKDNNVPAQETTTRIGFYSGEKIISAEQNYIMGSEPHCPLVFPLNQFLLK